jgi:energy-coupling factor transporter ATP-binding protein EcfA2
MVPQFQTAYLNEYLAAVEDTESPRIFHIWSAVFAVASALGRRCWLPFGTFDIFPNQYILLVGTPGTRKTTAANQAKKLLRSSTGVRFAPSDTGGQRQGLVLALSGGEESQTKEFLNGAELGSRENSIASLTSLDQVSNEPDDEELIAVAEADKHHLAVVASEFSRFIGQHNLSMLDFLGEVGYDGEDYEYRTRQTSVVLKKPLMNILGCTTPTMLNNSMPPAAGGQGFLSRMILVYGTRKYKQVPRPKAPPLDIVAKIKDRLNDGYHRLSGPFDETTDGRSYCESLYNHAIEIADSRFGYYGERRYTHLIKLGMCLAASRGDSTITKSDYEEANRILSATERGMPDALGEFGLNPLALLKQEILEQLRATQGPLTMEQVVAMFHRDARSREIAEVVNDLVKLGQVKLSQLPGGTRVISAVKRLSDTEDEMMKILGIKGD